MDKNKVLVVGASGYMGVQLIKLLIKHKGIKIVYLCGNNSIGKDINYFDNKIKKKTLPKIIKFNKKLTKNIDVIFTATPNGDAQRISKYLNNDQYLIDLSADFRLNSPRNYLKWYKKPHGAKNKIKKRLLVGAFFCAYVFLKCIIRFFRGIAQPGSAPALGAGGRRFKSCCPDQ